MQHIFNLRTPQATRLLILTSLIVGLWSCGGSKNDADPGEVLRRGLAGEPSSLDPAVAADNFSFQLLQDLYEGLTIESASGQIEPGVASSWAIDPSGTEYTFHLRNTARWSNGKPVRAQDFVFAWRRVVDPERGSLVSDDLRLISGASEIIAGRLPLSDLGVFARSDNVLVVKLERPAPDLPQILTHSATFPVYSEASANSHSPESWVSNGPYILTRWRPSTSVELARDPNYWDRENVRIAKVRYEIVPDQNSQLTQYRAGQIDVTDVVPANAIPWIKAEHPKELVVAPFLATAYFGINLSAPIFGSNLQLQR